MAVQVAFHDTTGKVHYVVSPGLDSDYEDGGVYGDYIARHISISEDPGLFAMEYYWGGDGWVWLGVRPDSFHVVVNGEWVVSEPLYSQYYLQERASRLFASDWTQLPDVSLTVAERSEAVSYRQALRDFTPIDYSVPYTDIEWPTKPDFIA